MFSGLLWILVCRAFFGKPPPCSSRSKIGTIELGSSGGWHYQQLDGGEKMSLEPITISVNTDVANAYRIASEEERRKLDLLVSLRLRDATRTQSSLKQIMTEISQNAQERGLTPDILQSILNES